MSVFLSPVGGAGAQFFDNNGNPLTGGKLYTYAAGTTTPQATYTSAAGSTFHTNPIVLDAAGRVPGSSEIWLSDSAIYKFVLKDSNDVLLATWDQITGVNSNFVNFTAQTEVQTATAGQTVFTLTSISYQPGTGSLTVFVDGVNQYEGTSYLETDSTTVTFLAGLHVGALVKFTTAIQTTGNATDASVVTYDPPFTGGVPTTVQDKLAQTVSIEDFGAVGDGVTDDSVAIQNALDSGATVVDFLGLPALIETSITVPSDVQAINVNLIAGTPGMNMVLVSHRSKVTGKLVGTGTTGAFERGIYPAVEGAEDVYLDLDVSNITCCVHAQPLTQPLNYPKRWRILGYYHDTVGDTGESEGYGVLLSGAWDSYIYCNFKNIKRNALYLSNGAKNNYAEIDVDTCGGAGVQFYARGTEEPVQYNTVRIKARNFYQGQAPTGKAVGAVILANSNYNKITLDMVGNNATDCAVYMEGESTPGGFYPFKNKIFDCHITGEFINFDVIKSVNGNSNEIYNNTITAYSTYAVIALRTSGTFAAFHGDYVENNKIDALAQNIIGIYDEVTEAPTTISNNDIRHNGTGLRVRDDTNGKRTGYNRRFVVTGTTGLIPANSNDDTVVTLPEPVQIARRSTFTRITGASVAITSNSNVIIEFPASNENQATFRIYNALGSAQTFNYVLTVEGD